ncbi:GNAT family N-acetyltransferase [Vibrio hannami]|uniref:GNAT family N-acetyltransferase n=1 Tax=Vibrio hannami TaxID=2717094 RepID=UPI00240F9784|nr:GNAT family N-acetyltransferase [Vibrio hannami]MDG3085999.1 GNAT family N-acetyltransferase [Vibrio hannami]
MDIQTILQEYNRFERIGESVPGCQKIQDNQVVKIVSPGKHGSYINYFDLSSEQADIRIEQEIEFFTRQNKGFEWKVYDTDTPSDMGERLVHHGFTAGERESFMVFDIEKHHHRFSNYQHRCTKVTSADQIKDTMSIHPQVWGGDFSHQEQALIDQFTAEPGSVSIYNVYVDGKVVSSARITFNGNSRFAGLWGGSTLQDYRGKGYYTDLLAARVLEAKQRGIKYLIIDASDMSRPIVEKYGFEFVTYTTPYEFEAPY